MAGVAQLVRAPVCGTGGRGFDSHHSPHYILVKPLMLARYRQIQMDILIQILLLFTLLFVSWVDIKTKSIPTPAILFLFGLGILWIIETKKSFFIQGSVAILGSALLWGLGFSISKIKKQTALGFGDVQLWAVLSLFLSLDHLPFFLMLSGGIGCLMTFFVPKKMTIPFAPALSLGFLITLYKLFFFKSFLSI